jgi:hypothetical protein
VPRIGAVSGRNPSGDAVKSATTVMTAFTGEAMTTSSPIAPEAASNL